MFRFLGRTLLILTLVATAGASVLAQKSSKGGPLACRNDHYNDRLSGHCEMREQTLAPTGGTIAVDAKPNGGITVKGWDQNQVLVRSRVRTGAPSTGEAVELARKIVIETGGAKIRAVGPDQERNYSWEVSFEVMVPRRADVSVETHNGGITIAEVNGKIDFNAMNGGVVLRRLGGTVRGSTMNGGLVVELGGDRWDGETLDVKTMNGGIVMSVPENYSAHLETGTVNGGIHVDFPVTVQGRITKELALDLGSGGATVKAMTTNGGVHVKRPDANE